MIYNKNVSFPYPIFCNDSTEYKNPYFSIDVDNLKFEDENNKLSMDFKLNINSIFIKKLIEENRVRLLMITNSHISMYEEIDFNCNHIELNTKVVDRDKIQIQILVVTKEMITMRDNSELVEFYDEYLDEIEIKKNSVIGYSDVLNLRKPDNDSLKLFNYKINENQKEDFKVKLTDKIIELHFSDKRFLLNGLGKDLLNMYFYNALSIALLNEFREELQTDGQELYIDSLVEDQEISSKYEMNLRNKLISLMLDKNIERLSADNIDEIIFRCSNDLIKKFVGEVEKLSSSRGNDEN